jgi:hypothetical protein
MTKDEYLKSSSDREGKNSFLSLSFLIDRISFLNSILLTLFIGRGNGLDGISC